MVWTRIPAFFLLTSSLKVTKSVNEGNDVTASVFSAGSNLYHSSWNYNTVSAALNYVSLPALSDRDLEIESWMTDPIQWVKAHESSLIKVEAEAALPVEFEESDNQIESWMINPREFTNSAPAYFEEAEQDIENWMIDPTWLGEKESQIEDWMTDPWDWAKSHLNNELFEDELQIESWMTDPKSFN